MQLNKHQQQMFEQAIHYADKGWYILPVSKMTQKPLIRDWTTQASNDRSQVISWFSDYPAMNIGLLTGEKSGFWVVDVQMRERVRGFDSLKKHFGKEFEWDLKKWLVGITATGGFHFLVKWDPERSVATKSGVIPGVEIQGYGGQIVVAPSADNVGDRWVEYRWNNPDLPICPFNEYPWVQKIATLEHKPSDPSNDTVLLERKPSKPSDFTAADVTRTMTGLEDDERSEMLNRYAGHLRAQGIDMTLAIGFIEEACQRAKPPFDRDKAAELVKQAYKAQVQKSDKTLSMTTFKLEQGKLTKCT